MKNLFLILLTFLFSNINSQTIVTKGYSFENKQKVILDGKDNYLQLSNNQQYLFYFNNVDTVLISNYILESINDSNTYDKGIYIVNAKYVDISDLTIKGFNDAGISILHNDTGINCTISNCYFINNYKNKSGNGLGYGISIYGFNKVWIKDPFILKPVIIKDCYFTGHRHSIAGGGNGLYEVYNCIFYNNCWSSHVIDGHPSRLGWPYNIYPTRLMKVYNNIIFNSKAKYYKDISNIKDARELVNNGIFCQGGTLICYNNTIIGTRFGIGLYSNNDEYVINNSLIYNNNFTKVEGEVSSQTLYNFNPDYIKLFTNYNTK